MRRLNPSWHNVKRVLKILWGRWYFNNFPCFKIQKGEFIQFSCKSLRIFEGKLSSLLNKCLLSYNKIVSKVTAFVFSWLSYSKNKSRKTCFQFTFSRHWHKWKSFSVCREDAQQILWYKKLHKTQLQYTNTQDELACPPTVNEAYKKAPAGWLHL